MGKPKKGKKGHQNDDFGDDDIDIDPVANKEEIEEFVPAKLAKSGKKGKKKKNDDWEDDVAAEIAEISLQQKQDDSDMNGEAEVIPQPKTKKKDKKKSKKKVESEEDMDSDEVEITSSKPYGGRNVAAFSMLDMDDSLGESSSEEEQKAEKQQETKVDVKKQKSIDEDQDGKNNQQQKKKGKKEKKKKKDEEDIDAILAEIQGEDKGINLKDASAMTQDDIAKLMEEEYADDDDKKKKKKKKKGGKEEEIQEKEPEDENEGEEGEDDEEEGGTVKTAAQKKKEKKERQRLKKLEEKAKQKNKKNKEATEVSQTEAQIEEPVQTTKEEKETDEAKNEEEDDKKPDEEGADDDKKKKKKDRRKKKGEKEEEKETKKKPSKMAMMIQEQQKKIKEEEERIRLEMEEKERKIEEARKAKEEQERKLKEKKEKEKQKKKEKIEKQKKDGTFLTAKQREAQKRAQAMLEARRAQGYIVPGDEAPAEEAPKKKRPIYEKKKKKPLSSQDSFNKEDTPTEDVPPVVEKPIEKEPEKEEAKTQEPKKEVKDSWDASDDDVKDAWDAESDTEAKETEKQESKSVSESRVSESSSKRDSEELSDEEESSEEEESDEDDDSSEEESSSEEEEDLTAAEKARNKALNRIQKRKETAEKNISTDNLRAAVVVVLGHVDTGKTKILDKLRRTNVQDNEAGGITQQIGATNVPVHAIRDSTKMCKDFSKQELKLPGLLIIDTPGHESFSNLRSRGSSLCDISILVVDIMHGLEPQTIESINLLKERKCPFVVALNKIDRLYGWQSNSHSDVINVIKKQKPNTKLEFEERAQQVMVQFAEQGLNAKLFYENKNPKEYISMVPTSAHTGDGMGNLVALICELSQTHLAKKLAYSEELHATVMEVKAIHGLGTTIDVILVNGKMNEGDTIIVPGTEGPIVTQIRGLLMPQPMKELRVKNAYEHHKEVKAAQGVKIIAKDLDHSLAGLPVYVAHFADEIDIYKEELKTALEDILSSIKLQEKGVFVQASTLGSLEALLQFLKDSKIPYAGINIGPVHKRDVMKLSVMLDRDPQYAVLLAFDVKVERDAQELADSLGIRIFTAEIIYHLFDSFMAYRDEYKKSKQEEFKHIAVFPCKLRVLPQCIFNSRDPIVMGVAVEAGFVKMGTPICVPSKENILLGHVTSLEVNHKQMDKATKGQEVCIKIENLPGETPKLYGRHFDHTDMLVSKISRESIDAVKDYFRDEMSKTDWHLILELKKMFQIL